MNISPIFNTSKLPPLFTNNLKKNTINFKGRLEADTFEKTSNTPKLEKGQLTAENGEIFTRPDTCMFRQDIDWVDFGKYLKKRFCFEDKVNTLVYACSTGDEAYTLSILLQEMLYNPEKFFPIEAKDINNDTVTENILNQEKLKTIKDAYLPTRWNLELDHTEAEKYVVVEKNQFERLTDTVTSPVKFSCANILEDIENINSDTPSFIMCRNMWPYVNPDEYQKFADKLYEKLAPGSVVVIGGYDYKGEDGREHSNDFPKALIKAGFETPDTSINKNNNKLIFEKN